MDSTNNRSVTLEELAMLLGAKDIEIFTLQKKLQESQKRIAEFQHPEKKAG